MPYLDRDVCYQPDTFPPVRLQQPAPARIPGPPPRLPPPPDFPTARLPAVSFVTTRRVWLLYTWHLLPCHTPPLEAYAATDGGGAVSYLLHCGLLPRITTTVTGGNVIFVTVIGGGGGQTRSVAVVEPFRPHHVWLTDVHCGASPYTYYLTPGLLCVTGFERYSLVRSFGDDIL